jgi:hypothetical protein
LTSAHQKTGAVDGPLAFKIHSAFFHPSVGPVFVSGFQVSGFDRARPPLGGMLVSSGATVRAERGRVNYTRIVQRWNFRSRIGWDESGSSMGRG